ncbi:MAG: hypothetical protein HC834_05900 [Rhodospirillales bacterium]|nr:hypothetical protein [Rhodospirillales bacterium]
MIQIDPEDLQQKSRDRIRETLTDTPIPVEILKQNHGIEPAEQIALAEELIGNAAALSRQLAWTGYPRYAQLETCCDLIWRHWVGRGRNDVFF